MVLELHTWGPAFGLPSIEAQSLATIAYFIQSVPPSEWRLIPSGDPTVGPINELPALRYGSEWICGFRGIVNFLREHSSGKWDLDQDLDEQQRADSVAFSSFLVSRGQPLLDLSLYVSSDNYTAWTRPALAQMLRWPNQWFAPHRLREDAKRRSEHLGLSSLDIETAGKEDGDTNPRGTGGIPKNLVTRPKETTGSILGKSGRGNQFRLDAVTSDFFEPLCDLVEKNGRHSWVFGRDKASSLDCLLLAYIALMSPPLMPPHNWLRDALSARYPVLLQWATNFRQEIFGGPIRVADVLCIPTSTMPASYPNLPWYPATPVRTEHIGSIVLNAIIHSLPIVSRFFPVRIVRTSPRTSRGFDESEASVMVRSLKSPWYAGLGIAGSALGAGMAYCIYEGLFGPREGAQQAHTYSRRNMTRQRDFGEAGRMLGVGMM